MGLIKTPLCHKSVSSGGTHEIHHNHPVGALLTAPRTQVIDDTCTSRMTHSRLGLFLVITGSLIKFFEVAFGELLHRLIDIVNDREDVLDSR